jgi:hypothetical protein
MRYTTLYARISCRLRSSDDCEVCQWAAEDAQYEDGWPETCKEKERNHGCTECCYIAPERMSCDANHGHDDLELSLLDKKKAQIIKTNVNMKMDYLMSCLISDGD